MPYTMDSDLPANVMKMPMAKKKKWIAIFNSTHKSCMDDGGSEKTCEAKAFRFANGVLKKDRDEGGGMDWLTRMFNKLIGLNHKERALSLDNLMQKIYKHMYEMEEANKTYYSIARLMVDESGLWVVLNDHGTLYRTNVSVDASGEVTLSEPQEVKEEYTPVKQNRVWLKRQI